MNKNILLKSLAGFLAGFCGVLAGILAGNLLEICGNFGSLRVVDGRPAQYVDVLQYVLKRTMMYYLRYFDVLQMY